MTSKYKAVTDNTRQSSSAARIAKQGQPLGQSASSDNTQTSTPTLRRQSTITLTTGATVSEKNLQYAVLMKVVLSSLIKAGLAEKYRVLSKDKSVIKEYQIIFPANIWTETLELKVLSTTTTEAK